MATTAIAILNYNGRKHLEKFLPSLLKNSANVPIYIGDNASTDDSVEFIRNSFPNAQLIELGDNYGYSKGYNLLINHIEEDYIGLVNSDIEVTANWLAPLVKALDNNVELAAVQPKIKSYHNKAYFEYAGAAGGFIDTYGYPLCRGRIFDTLEKDEGQYDDNTEITWASGACFLVRKSAFNIVNGFDDDFFAHMEEIDLCWRMIRKGFSIQFNSESEVYHVGGGTLAYESPFKTYLNFRNGLYLLIKNMPKQNFKRKLITRVLLDWLSAFYFLLQGKGKQFIAVFKAHIKVLKSWRYVYAKRTMSASDKRVLERYSVVWQYFIKGKKTYAELEK
ncbi:MAG: glycosyltransferase family 2 protein [Cyclobacteriaceae bacterium]|nr:glycosyltransferase family 2 protein [Cyclobacteriaceae bacterium]